MQVLQARPGRAAHRDHLTGNDSVPDLNLRTSLLEVSVECRRAVFVLYIDDVNPRPKSSWRSYARRTMPARAATIGEPIGIRKSIAI